MIAKLLVKITSLPIKNIIVILIYRTLCSILNTLLSVYHKHLFYLDLPMKSQMRLPVLGSLECGDRVWDLQKEKRANQKVVMMSQPL